ncbi:phosphatidylserine decarboxylase proenzyme, mitochondrial-like isoform X2 [Pomacea canaliculata]|uniref:phosphatidylserine decarboxylase proenzyme, mitochondrial-like isoform X2 n=1 Tax=Pomacea canaliculata TaxID=400727 RepID=UPI000D733224|nr:phosphatidylserine decarboxylase proenzyme, mitochondrial-like isoform X2 [Pomacea canaliculata]
MAGTFARFVRVASQPCPRCMCSYSALTLKTANIRFMSNGHRLMNVQERHLPKKKWKLRTLGLAFGSSTVAYLLYHQDAEVKNLEVTLYRKMPLKAMSRLWGRFNELELPIFLRRPLLSLYIWMFGCRLDEAEVEDLRHYRNLGEFFRRQLKPDVRPIDDNYVLTSPSDGKILHYGRVENGILEQVKGVTYSLRGFLGPQTWRDAKSTNINHISDTEYQEELGMQPDHDLFHCIIYLAPGDYHRFHSPTNWVLHHRRHFPGELLSVNPGIARWIQGLFNFNERAVYTGTWDHGFFSMCAVGATNVGSIKIYCDEDLKTNTRSKYPEGAYFDKVFQSSIQVAKGSMFGEFNLGSTIVLIFEAPKGFQFKVHDGQKIRFGQALGTLS